MRDGGTAEELDELERTTRLPAIQERLEILPALVRDGLPVFMTGDFNSPSHLDWTPAVDAVRDVVRFPFDWPVSRAIADAGFRDSYREVHPDPVAVPGFTWTPGGLESVPNEVHDRIDWVLASGRARAVESEIVGERGGPDVDIAIKPYPTDHRGVVSTFVVRAGRADRCYVAVGSRRLAIGDMLTAVFHGSGRRGERVAIVRAGGDDALAELPTYAEDGTLTFPTAGLARGAYEAVLLDKHDRAVSRSPFWLYRPRRARQGLHRQAGLREGGADRASPGRTRRGCAGTGSPSTASSRAARPPYATPGCNTGYCGNDGYLLYEYTHTAIEGTSAFSRSSAQGYGTWPLRPGLYEVRLLLDDGYSSVAKSPRFRIVPR